MVAETSLQPSVALTHAQMSARPWRTFRDLQGVLDKVVWEDAETNSYAGVMRLEPGSSVPSHSHRGHVHHIWVVAGLCRTLGRDLNPGSYSYVPAGVDHDLRAEGPDGCVIFYLYLSA